MANTNRITIKTRNTAFIAGTKKRFTALSTIILDGAPYTPAAIVSAFQAEMDTADAVAPANAAWRAKVAAAKTAKQAVETMLPSFEQYVRNLYGNDPEALADFGLEPKPARVVSSATKAEAAQKSAVTKAAGGAKAKKSTAASPAPEAPVPAPTTPKA